MTALVGFRWLGVAGIELRAAGQTLVLDPFLSRPPFWRLWFGRVAPNRPLVAETLPRCDHILVTHAHYDHVMDVPDVVGHTGAVAYGSANTCRLLVACGVPSSQCREIVAGDELVLGPFRLEVLDAQHLPLPGFAPGPLPPDLDPPLRLRDYVMDACFGFRIEVNGLRILDWHSVRAGPAPSADVLLTFPWEGRGYYASLLRDVQPGLVIPLHWDDLFRPLSRPLRPFFEPPRWAWPPLRRVDLHRFAGMIEEIAPGTRVLVPEILAIYDLAHLAQA